MPTKSGAQRFEASLALGWEHRAVDQNCDCPTPRKQATRTGRTARASNGRVGGQASARDNRTMGSYKGSGDPGLARGDLDLVVALVDDGVARVVRAVARDRVDRGYVHLAVRGHDPRRPTVVILGGAGRRGPQHPVLVEGGGEEANPNQTSGRDTQHLRHPASQLCNVLRNQKAARTQSRRTMRR